MCFLRKSVYRTCIAPVDDVESLRTPHTPRTRCRDGRVGTRLGRAVCYIVPCVDRSTLSIFSFLMYKEKFLSYCPQIFSKYPNPIVLVAVIINIQSFSIERLLILFCFLCLTKSQVSYFYPPSQVQFSFFLLRGKFSEPILLIK